MASRKPRAHPPAKPRTSKYGEAAGRIRATKKKHPDWTQSEIAHHLGVSRQLVNQTLSTDAPPGRPVIPESKRWLLAKLESLEAENAALRKAAKKKPPP